MDAWILEGLREYGWRGGLYVFLFCGALAFLVLTPSPAVPPEAPPAVRPGPRFTFLPMPLFRLASRSSQAALAGCRRSQSTTSGRL